MASQYSIISSLRYSTSKTDNIDRLAAYQGHFPDHLIKSSKPLYFKPMITNNTCFLKTSCMDMVSLKSQNIDLFGRTFKTFKAPTFLNCTKIGSSIPWGHDYLEVTKTVVVVLAAGAWQKDDSSLVAEVVSLSRDGFNVILVHKPSPDFLKWVSSQDNGTNSGVVSHFLYTKVTVPLKESLKLAGARVVVGLTGNDGDLESGLNNLKPQILEQPGTVCVVGTIDDMPAGSTPTTKILGDQCIVGNVDMVAARIAIDLRADQLIFLYDDGIHEVIKEIKGVRFRIWRDKDDDGRKRYDSMVEQNLIGMRALAPQLGEGVKQVVFNKFGCLEATVRGREKYDEYLFNCLFGSRKMEGKENKNPRKM